MSPERVFAIANLVAAAAWLLLAVLPRQRWVTTIVTGTAVPAFFAVAYIAIIGSQWGTSSGSFSTLGGVSTLFANPWLLLAGWLHYLAFDLLAGTWEVSDARERDVPHLLVVPCLALTFMFGPAGWLLYNGVRARYRRA
ncbi:MAG TPA: ABA4-like family protein [Vicinamibacterales bacterium]|nr:ABA4-like family protein [Vicinamibacterales bacterium]